MSSHGKAWPSGRVDDYGSGGNPHPHRVTYGGATIYDRHLDGSMHGNPLLDGRYGTPLIAPKDGPHGDTVRALGQAAVRGSQGR